MRVVESDLLDPDHDEEFPDDPGEGGQFPTETFLEVLNYFSNLKVGQAVRAEGVAVHCPDRPHKWEIHADTLSLVGEIDPSYPIQPNFTYDPRFVRKHMHLRSKTASFAAFLRIRSAVRRHIMEFFETEDFLHIDTPILTGNDCEGTAENVFVLEEGPMEGNRTQKRFFHTPVFLSVSGQLHLEAVASGISKVYSFNPTFRAEKQTSRNHLSEFYMVEGEMAFADKLEDVMQTVEKLIRFVCSRMTNNTADIESVRNFHSSVETNSNEASKEEYKFEKTVLESDRFPRIKYSDAILLLESMKDELNIPPILSEGLSRQHELALVKHFGNTPLFITHYPSGMKPFYMKTSPNGQEAECFDLVCPMAGEVCGGSLREDDYALLTDRCPQNLQWYAELRKFGHAPCGGFGIGFERLLQSMLGVFNLKDCTPFPRWHKSCIM